MVCERCVRRTSRYSVAANYASPESRICLRAGTCVHSERACTSLLARTLEDVRPNWHVKFERTTVPPSAWAPACMLPSSRPLLQRHHEDAVTSRPQPFRVAAESGRTIARDQLRDKRFSAISRCGTGYFRVLSTSKSGTIFDLEETMHAPSSKHTFTSIRLNPIQALACGSLLAWVAFTACAGQPTSDRPAHAPKEPQASLPECIAEGLIARSPVGDPADAKARDIAGEKLAQFELLQNSIDDYILWGGFVPAQGYDPTKSKLTAFNGFVWAKLYLSTFMFTGPYTVSQDGPRTVLEVPVKFRADLDSGDYPYPFWHSAKKWQGYLDAKSVAFVFEKDRLIASFRKPVRDPQQPLAQRPWDGRWSWDDNDAHAQPHVALYSYLLSKDNPHTQTLEKAYRELEQGFRKQECLACHSPDNTALAAKLFMLNYPNQALAGRHELITVLDKNTMPPLDEKTGRVAGMHDDKARADLRSLAKAFEREGDAALEYERGRARKVESKSSQ